MSLRYGAVIFGDLTHHIWGEGGLGEHFLEGVDGFAAGVHEQVEDAEARLEAVARCPHLVVRHVGNG